MVTIQPSQSTRSPSGGEANEQSDETSTDYSTLLETVTASSNQLMFLVSSERPLDLYYEFFQCSPIHSSSAFPCAEIPKQFSKLGSLACCNAIYRSNLRTMDHIEPRQRKSRLLYFAARLRRPAFMCRHYFYVQFPNITMINDHNRSNFWMQPFTWCLRWA